MSKHTIIRDPDTTTIVLKKPVQTKNSKRLITEVTLSNDCTVADMEEMDTAKGEQLKTIKMIVQLADLKRNGQGPLTVGHVKMMASADYLAIAKELGRIMGTIDEEETEVEEGLEEKKTSGPKQLAQTSGRRRERAALFAPGPS